MKNIFIYLLMITTIMCQDKLTTTRGETYSGKVISSEIGTIEFEFGDGYKKVFPTSSVQRLVLNDGTILIDRNKLQNKNNSSGSVVSFSINLQKVGSSLIGLSGVILYFTNQLELNNDATFEDYEDYVDKIKSRTDIAYISLGVGGFLMELGENNADEEY